MGLNERMAISFMAMLYPIACQGTELTTRQPGHGTPSLAYIVVCRVVALASGSQPNRGYSMFNQASNREWTENISNLPRIESKEGGISVSDG